MIEMHMPVTPINILSRAIITKKIISTLMFLGCAPGHNVCQINSSKALDVSKRKGCAGKEESNSQRVRWKILRSEIGFLDARGMFSAGQILWAETEGIL